MARYRRPAQESRFEPPPLKGSRFLASVAPAADEGEAEAYVERLRAEYDDARHVCFAWRLGRAGSPHRSSDAGEPSGSAGRPMLAQLEGHGVSDCVAVVVRYFGGVKLGVGGLMRAYGGALGACLDRAPFVEVEATRTVRVMHPYDCSGPVQGLLHAEGLVAAEGRYGAEVELVLRVPEDRLAAFLIDLGNRTAGRAQTQIGE